MRSYHDTTRTARPGRTPAREWRVVTTSIRDVERERKMAEKDNGLLMGRIERQRARYRADKMRVFTSLSEMDAANAAQACAYAALKFPLAEADYLAMVA